MNEPVLDLLAARVPLTLLCDLLAPTDSHEVLAAEAPDLGWLAPRRPAGPPADADEQGGSPQA